ncbi:MULTISPECIES: hypothetical protein [unclassified Bradyrhizobium]|uniref:hypothetical protein n=1 Tax=unclassified Bradyrhizobium TaxID=2631580 RepID=UPI0028F03408|nr:MULTISPECIES: hypothetical protein [unclassified Bradyrhizobium]
MAPAATCPAGAGGAVSRRIFMNVIASIAASTALPVHAAAAVLDDDPIFAVIEDYRSARARAEAALTDHDIDQTAARWFDAIKRFAATEPTTVRGLLAMLIFTTEIRDVDRHAFDGLAIFESFANSARALSARLAIETMQPRQFDRSAAASPSADAATPMTERKLRMNDDVADLAIIELAGRYIVAEQLYCDLQAKFDKVQFQDPRTAPAELRWRDDDAQLFGPFDRKPDDGIWHRGCDIDPLRSEKWWQTKQSDTEAVTGRAVVPSDAARARANEIIAAYDRWTARPPRGYKAAKRRVDRAEREYRRLEDELFAARAMTPAGMHAKIRCAMAYAKSDTVDSIDSGGCSEVMALSVFEDIAQLVKSKRSGDRRATETSLST